MTNTALGIDIGDCQIAVVELTRQGKSLKLKACHSLPRDGGDDLGERLRQLPGWSGRADVCVCGVSLALLGVRNLSLPFKDAKSIAQTLPFELEEQLLVPVDRRVTDFALLETDEAGSRVIAFALEKVEIARLLDSLQGAVDPDSVTPTAAALATQIARIHGDGRSLLLMHLEAHCLAVILLVGEKPILYRRIPCPESLTVPLASTGSPEAEEAIEQGIRLLCDTVERTIDFFCLEHRVQFEPAAVVLTGPAATTPALAERIGHHLGLVVELPDLLTAAAVACPDQNLRDAWGQHLCDGALALALQGLGRKGGINLRKAEFARKVSLRSVRKQMIVGLSVAALLVACLFGYVTVGYKRLQSRDRAMKEEMTAIFKQTFPAVTTVREPHTEMLAAMKGIQGPGAPVPNLVTDRRVLALLADISARIPAAIPLQVGRLSIDQGSVQIKGVTDTFNAVETIKSKLAASSRFSEVRIVSATADKGKGKEGGVIRFELQLQLRGA